MTRPFLKTEAKRIFAAALLVTVVFLCYGLRHGKLLSDYLSDDNLYLQQGLRLLEGFYADGFGGLIKTYVAEPPHAPLSALLIGFIFAVGGISNWLPYLVLGSAFLALYFGVFVRVSGAGRGAGVWGVLAVLALLPLSQEIVLELRPEYGYGVWVAIAVVLVLTGPSSRRIRDSALAGAVWGCAFAMKTPFAPLTLGLAGFVLLAEEAMRWKEQPPALAWREAVRHLSVKAAVMAVFLLPVVARASYYTRYIYTNIYGEHASVWTLHGGFWQRLFFQLSGRGGQQHLGPWLPVVISLFVIGSIYSMVRGPTIVRWHVLVLDGAALIFIAAFAAAPADNPHLGAPLQMLLLLGTVHFLSIHAWAWLAGRPALGLGLLALAIGFGLASFSFKVSRWGSLDDPAMRDRRRVHSWALETIGAAPESGVRPLLFFTFSSKLMNSYSLRWAADRDGAAISIAELRESADWNAQREHIEQADFILAAEAGAAEIHGWLPSARLHVEACRYVREQPDRFAEIGRFRTYTGKDFFLFRRIREPGRRRMRPSRGQRSS